MKKLLKISGIILLSLFLLLLVFPFLFKGKVKEVLMEQVNNNLNAKFDFKTLDLSLISNFPNLSIRVNDLYLSGVGKFEKDTLLKMNSFKMTVNLASALKMKDIEIRSIYLDAPVINAITLADSSVNWDIMKVDTTVVETASVDSAVDSSSSSFNVKLKKLKVIDGTVIYDDRSGDMYASLEGLDYNLSGDLAMDVSTLKMNAIVNKLVFKMEDIKYLSDAKVTIDAEVNADIINSVYTIISCSGSLNEILLQMTGFVAMPNDTDMVMDLKYATTKTDFKSVLSLIPAVYMTDFQDVKASGKITLDGFVKGTYNDLLMPSVGFKLLVENGMFRYPSLPKSADNINIDIDLYYDGVQADSTTLDINKFHVEMAGNPFDFQLSVRTPETDMQISTMLKGKIDLTSILDVIPLVDTKMSGLIICDIKAMGRMSTIENEKYEDFNAGGSLGIRAFSYISKDFPQGMEIKIMEMNFTPKLVELVQFDSKIGKSDMKLKGSISNFIPYVFTDAVLKGEFLFEAGLIDLNEFMADEESESTTASAQDVPVDTVPLELIEIPKNLDFKLTSTITKMLYDNFDITNTYGIIEIRDGKMLLTNLKMDMLKGSIIMDGVYNTQDMNNPLVDFTFQIKDFDIPSSYTTFNTIQKLAPIAQNCKGSFSCNLDYVSFLDAHMMPILNSIAGKGRLASKSIEIGNSETLKKLGDALKNDKFKNLVISDLDIQFEIKEGRIYIDPPLTAKFGSNSISMGGDQGLDQTMNYKVNLSMPRTEFGALGGELVNSMMGAVAKQGVQLNVSDMINLDVIVGGTFSKPEIKLGMPDMKSTSTVIKDQVEQKVKAEVMKKVDDTKVKAKAEADRMIKIAEEQAERLRAEARIAAEQVRKESYTAADKLVKEQKNPIAKKAAEITADKIKKEGDKKASAVISEGDSKADGLVAKAKSEAAKLLK